MKLAEVSVKRPVFAIMMTAALIVLGAFSYKDLGLDLMPKTDSPDVNVQVQLPGASAEEVETQITKRIEEAVNTISGIDELRANSNQGQGQVEHHLHARARHRIGHPGRPRQGRHHRRPVSARREAAADHEAGSRRVADPPVQRLRPAIAEGDHPDRRQADQAGARDVEGCRRGQPPGRSQARDPAAAERRPAQRLRPERRSGADRGHAPERRSAGRQLHRRPIGGGAPHDGPHQERRRFQPDRARLSRRLGRSPSPTSAGCRTRCRKSARPTS